MSRDIGFRDHLIGLTIAAAYVALLLASSATLGMSRDEGFYVEAANRYAAWFEQLADDSSAAMSREGVQRGWEYNHEHPSLVKSAFALFHLAQQKWELFPTASMGYRFAGMLSSGLLLWLIYIFGARAYGRQVGLFAAFAFCFLASCRRRHWNVAPASGERNLKRTRAAFFRVFTARFGPALIRVRGATVGIGGPGATSASTPEMRPTFLFCSRITQSVLPGPAEIWRGPDVFAKPGRLLS